MEQGMRLIPLPDPGPYIPSEEAEDRSEESAGGLQDDNTTTEGHDGSVSTPRVPHPNNDAMIIKGFTPPTRPCHRVRVAPYVELTYLKEGKAETQRACIFKLRVRGSRQRAGTCQGRPMRLSLYSSWPCNPRDAAARSMRMSLLR
jgi:hypothetical protein